MNNLHCNLPAANGAYNSLGKLQVTPFAAGIKEDMIAAYITALWAGRASCRDAGGAADGISSRRRRQQQHTHTPPWINKHRYTHSPRSVGVCAASAAAINDIKPL